MSSMIRIVLVLVLFVIVGGVAALAMRDIPAPTTKIQKVIPDDHFPH
ncbi:hypothetical protein GALL_208670 [mine drainage metagenome]|uniref:Uncharacterized protein n=1 Tax=mine drainage metagenome TaxID=410659 RepID=A0A1J5RZ14_9ZZZZ